MLFNLLNKKFFVVLLLVPFFIPMALQYIPATENLYGVLQIFKVLDVAFITLMYLTKYRGRLSYLDYLVIAFGCWYVLSCLMNDVPFTKPLSNMLLSMGCIFIVRLARDVNQNVFFKSLAMCALFSFITNFIVSMIWPGGMIFATLYRNWFNPLYLYATDNGMVKFLILPIFIFFARYFLVKKNKGVLAINICIALASIVVVDSASGLGIVALFVMLACVYIIFLKKNIPQRAFVIGLILFEVLIVVLGSSLGVINDVAEMFGRESNFTGRDFLWQTAVYRLDKMPFWGYGYSDGLLSVWGGHFSSHNLYLELILHGGWVLIVLFGLINFYAIKKLGKKSFVEKNLIFLALLGFWIDGLVEVGITHTYYFILAFAVYGLKNNHNEVVK